MADIKPDIQAIFCEALDRKSPTELAQYLDAACGTDATLRTQVEDLLRSNRAAGRFLGGSSPSLAVTEEQSSLKVLGTLIGLYKLLQQIGEGGMGTVYMAEQTAPVHRKVALKLIKPGMDSRQVIARFEAERQALALMDHPNIAKVLDAGTTDNGLPYFVMELVEGVPITKYSDEHRLTPRERLELFIPVCKAVQHAHQKGIIHRDLKPSNVLVAIYDSRPVPKVIDFGVAKATGPKLTERTMYTEFGAIVGTLEYMSPEQVDLNQLDIDTRSDIYSLGVLLYELLTGTTPFEKKRLNEAALMEVFRIIREDEPPKPSTRLSSTDELPSISANRGLEPKKLSDQVRGELDWIVMKALEKDRTRRYETANNFAADVLCYLSDRPVEACAPSSAYRFRKFARRNRVAISTVAVVLIALLLGTVLSVAQAIRAVRAETLAESRLKTETEAKTKAVDAQTAAEKARQNEAEQRKVAEEERNAANRAREAETQQRQIADENARKARQTVDEYFTLVSESKLLDVPGLQPLRKELLRSALDYYRGFCEQQTDDSALLADLAIAELRIGQIMYANGDHPDGWFPHLQHAIEILEKLVQEGRDTLAVQRRVAGWLKSNPEPLRWEAGGISGDPDEVQKVWLRTAKLWEKFVQGNSDVAGFQSDLAGIYLWIAIAKYKANERAEAILYAERAHDLWEKLVRDHPGEPRFRLELAQLCVTVASVAPRGMANQFAHKAQRILEKLVTEFPGVFGYRLWLGISYLRVGDSAGRAEEAEQAYTKAWEQFDKLVAEVPSEATYRKHLAVASMQLGSVRGKRGDHVEAIKFYEQAVRMFESFVGEPNVWWRDQLLFVETLRRLSRNLVANGQAEKAEQPLRRATGILEELVLDPLGHASTLVSTYTELSNFLKQTGRASEIEEVHLQGTRAFQRSVEAAQKRVLDATLPAQELQRLAWRYTELGTWFIEIGQSEKTLEAIRHALTITDKLAADFPTEIRYREGQIISRLNLGRLMSQAGQFSEAQGQYSKALEVNPQNPLAHNNLAWFLCTCSDTKVRDPSRAVELARRAVELAPKERSYWNTLGAAYYRAGNWKAATEAFEKSIALSSGGGVSDWFFLAMADWQLGEKDEARKWYDKAVVWMNKNAPNDEELRRFRAEAASLLEIKEIQTPSAEEAPMPQK